MQTCLQTTHQVDSVLHHAHVLFSFEAHSCGRLHGHQQAVEAVQAVEASLRRLAVD